VAQTAGLRFFFVRTLKRRFPPDSIPLYVAKISFDPDE